MFCEIAELITQLPDTQDLISRCREYRLTGKPEQVDVVISPQAYRPEKYRGCLKEAEIAYLESGFQFYRRLLDFEGFYLHSSAVALEGRAYLFSGGCGVGKSTHSGLWQQSFGAQVFNDDKPALRRRDGCWYAYGTPWCGKDGINQNRKVPLAGICFLKQGQENRIRQLSRKEAVPRIMGQTIRAFARREELTLLMDHVGALVREIPVYELENRPEPEAAALSLDVMRRGAKELGL